MRISHRSLRIEIEQTTVRLQWGAGEIPPDGGRQMVTDLLAASQELLDRDISEGTVQHEKDSDPRDENP